MSYAEYVAAESKANSRHEYLRGEVYDRTSGTLEHAALSAALAGELGVALQGRPCRTFSSDARVRIEATDMTIYPDLTEARKLPTTGTFLRSRNTSWSRKASSASKSNAATPPGIGRFTSSARTSTPSSNLDVSLSLAALYRNPLAG
jgi:hypothetical protein